LACYLKNGRPFIDKFFLEHHFGRFTTGALMHRQAPWFYLPVLAAGLVPWTPLALLLPRRSFLAEPRRRFLALTLAFGLVFFSLSTNKLPGYLLPLLPLAAALMGLALAELRDARAWLGGCALFLTFVLVAARMLPTALVQGLSRSPLARPDWAWTLPLLVAAAVWWLESLGRRVAAVAVLAIAFTVGVAHLKIFTLPQLDRIASARRFQTPQPPPTCAEQIPRIWRYGFNYYATKPLPPCGPGAKP
jgi:4-amino-4-deoxy-L-arabinose transferase-like glycosyltransferase